MITVLGPKTRQISMRECRLQRWNMQWKHGVEHGFIYPDPFKPIGMWTQSNSVHMPHSQLWSNPTHYTHAPIGLIMRRDSKNIKQIGHHFKSPARRPWSFGPEVLSQSSTNKSWLRLSEMQFVRFLIENSVKDRYSSYTRCSDAQCGIKPRHHVGGILNVNSKLNAANLKIGLFVDCVFRLVQFHTQQLQASVSLRRCTAAALYTSNMAAV